MALPPEPQLDAVMDQALAQHPLPRARADESVHRALLQHAGPHPVLHVVAAAGLQHHRLDAAQVQQVGQQQPGRPGADDRDLSAHPPRIGPPLSERQFAWRAFESEGNPLDDIRVLTTPQRSLKFIMKDGQVYKNEL